MRAGQYRSAEEAVDALLAMTMEQERLTPKHVGTLRAELDPAIAEADRREFVNVTAETVIADRRAGRGAQGRLNGADSPDADVAAGLRGDLGPRRRGQLRRRRPIAPIVRRGT